MNALAWGAKVSPEFRDKARAIAARIGTEPSSLMACIAFETGKTFSPKARNPQSSATGLIQFMRSTAESLGTTVEELAGMSAEAQLSFVYDYLRPFTGRVSELGDLYMAILYPPAVGKPDDFAVFENASAAYRANAGLDFNHDGVITKRECVSVVEKVLAEGLQVGNRAFEQAPDVQPIPLPAEEPPSQPTEETAVPFPAIVLGLIQAAASVLPVIAQIKGDKSQTAATQNLAVASKVLDVVATTVGAVNQQQAVEIITQNPEAAKKADDAIRAQFFDLLAFAKEQDAIAWERTEKSVAEARSFAERMTSGEGWRAIGYGALIGFLAVLIIGGSGWMFNNVLFADREQFDDSTRSGIIETMKTIAIFVVGFFFGSSATSRQTGEALRNIAQGKSQ